MRDRLVKLLKQAEKQQSLNAVCGDIDSLIDSPKGAEFIADYLLANGAKVPLYDVGDTVYYYVLLFDKVGKFKIVNRREERRCYVYEIRQESGLLHFFVDEASLYHTREEAERSLKGGEQE